MVGIVSAGIGSGLDVTGLITQLIAAEGQTRYSRINQQEARTQAEISAIGQVKSALATFQGSLSSITNLDNYQSRTANNSINTIFSVQVDATATPGSYETEVTQLAQTHKLTTAAFAEVSDTVGTGTLSFQFGTYDAGGGPSFTLNNEKTTGTVIIDETNNTVEGIRDAVNDADIGVTASIINDGTGQRLVFGSGESGANNSLKITVDDGDTTDTNNSGLSQLAFDPLAVVGSGKNLTQTVAAQDAALIVDGINVTSGSNTVTDVIDGVTLNLKKAEVDTKTITTVSTNPGQITGKVNSFVDGYNALVDQLNNLTGYDAETGQSGFLNGDATLRILDRQIKEIVTSAVSQLAGPYQSLGEIGVTTNSSGGLDIDSTKLSAAIDANINDVGKVFTLFGDPSDKQVLYDNASEETQAGNYNVSVSQLATQGNVTGSAAAALTITESVNDTLVLDIDGTTATIAIAAGTYTATSLASEIQSRINGISDLKDNNKSVTVSESSGVLSITSNAYGSESIVDITGGNAQASLLGGSPSQTTGVDVVGTIGGISATGAGRYLTGLGDASGLKLEIIGGLTGARGNINFSRGIAEQLDDLLSSYLATDGGIEERSKLLGNRVERYADEREIIDRRLASMEARLVSQFSALDALISQMRSTSDFLTTQLANLPGVRQSNN